MSFLLLSTDMVEAIHDAVLNPGELTGRALDKSLDGALARVDNRLVYGMVSDAFDLAASYASAIANGHCFNDGNKRTAYRCILVCLDLNGISIAHDTQEVGQLIISVAQRLTDEDDLAQWLRRAAP